MGIVRNVQRVSISIPKDLYRRLQKRRDLCWSRIATVALEAAVNNTSVEAEVVVLRKALDEKRVTLTRIMELCR
jgi:hypothetical protein